MQGTHTATSKGGLLFGIQPKFHMVAAALTFVSSGVFAQIGNFPTAYWMLSAESAKRVAQCELSKKASAGETEQFLLAVEALSPGILGARSANDLAKQLLSHEDSKEGSSRDLGCDEFLASTKQQLPSKIACLRKNETALGKNKALHAKLFSESIERQKGAVSCLGMCASRPNETVHGTTSCNSPAPVFEVACIEAGGPADIAGAKEGDELISIDGSPLTFPLDFEVAILAKEPKQQVRLTTRRSGKETSHILTVGTSRLLKYCHRIVPDAVQPMLSWHPIFQI